MKVNAHGVSVGFLLVYECMVFGDTSDNIDEVFSPRFFIVYPSVGTNFLLIALQTKLKDKLIRLLRSDLIFMGCDIENSC